MVGSPAGQRVGLRLGPHPQQHKASQAAPCTAPQLSLTCGCGNVYFDSLGHPDPLRQAVDTARESTSVSAEESLQATLILPKQAQGPPYESRGPSYDGLAADINNGKGVQCGMPVLPLQAISVISWLGRWYRRCHAMVGLLVGQRVGLRVGPHP